jgi:serine/threonine protein kinase
MGGLTTRQLQSRRLRKARTQQLGQLQPGDMLQNRYRILGTLGVGGFSSVYQARDMRFQSVTRLCAVKEMINLAANPTVRDLTVKSFEREASILATLDHPSVVDVYDYFTEEERSYLVLEFIRGKDLETVLNERDTFFSQEETLDLALQICDVLSFLHNHEPQPIIFRDMKPSNIMLDPHDRIRMIDFNIAKLFQSDEKNTTIGTEGYAPPEQYRGEASPAGDVYGLGATLHHLLTKQDPRLEPPFSIPERLIHAVNPDVDPAFEAIIMRCVNYNAEDRYQDAARLKEDLLRLSSAKRTRYVTGLLNHPSTAGLLNPPVQQEAQDQPQARAAAQGRSRKARSTVEPQWVFQCEDEIRSRPAVGDGMVFAGAYDNNLYAVNINDGAFVWKFPAAGGIGSSPKVANSVVMFGSVDHHVYQIRTNNGRANWRFAAGGPVYSSPVARFNHVFFGADDGYFYAINMKSGRLAWKVQAYAAVRSSPYVGEDLVYFGTEGGLVFGVDLAGRMKWQFQARRAVTSSPTLYDGMIIVGGLDNTIYALDASSGWAIWRFRVRRPIVSSPLVYKGVVYIGSADGNLYALDAETGRKRWQFETEGQIASSPDAWGEAVYFGSTDRNVYSVDIQRGELRWQFKTGGLVVSSPRVADGVVYIGSADGKLYALPT